MSTSMTAQNLAIRPFVGGPEFLIDEATVRPGGLAGDRQVLAYDPKTKKQLGSSRIPALTALGLELDADGFSLTDPGGDHSVHFSYWPTLSPDMRIDVHGDETPCTDITGTDLDTFEKMLGRRVGVAQKAIRWLTGELGPPPERRAQAPLHVVTDGTMDWVNQRLAEANDHPVDHTPLRPSFTITGAPEPHVEQSWVGKVLKVGSSRYLVTRGTERCGVPDRVPTTPKESTGIQDLYRHPDMPKSNRSKALIGVYLVPILGPAEITEIANGDPVGLVEA